MQHRVGLDISGTIETTILLLTAALFYVFNLV